MVVVVEEEGCGLLVIPKPNISICQHLISASLATGGLSEVSSLTFNGHIVQQ